MNLNGRDEHGFTREVEGAFDRHAGERCCRSCRCWKPEDTYHFRRIATGYLLRTCRTCEAARRRVERRGGTPAGQRNRDRIRERYWQNPEAERERSRAKYRDRQLAEAC